jgi:hypothetical protein
MSLNLTAEDRRIMDRGKALVLQCRPDMAPVFKMIDALGQRRRPRPEMFNHATTRPTISNDAAQHIIDAQNKQAAAKAEAGKPKHPVTVLSNSPGVKACPRPNAPGVSDPIVIDTRATR